MAYISFRDFCVATQLAREDQFDEWQSDWRRERAESDLEESLPTFLCKRSGKSEADFLGCVSEAYDWECIQLSEVKPTAEARRRTGRRMG